MIYFNHFPAISAGAKIILQAISRHLAVQKILQATSPEGRHQQMDTKTPKNSTSRPNSSGKPNNGHIRGKRKHPTGLAAPFSTWKIRRSCGPWLHAQHKQMTHRWQTNTFSTRVDMFVGVSLQVGGFNPFEKY